MLKICFVILFIGLTRTNTAIWVFLLLVSMVVKILEQLVPLLIFMDPCIVDYSVEIPTRCSFVIEFIILKFIEGSTCFDAAHRSSSGALNCICSLWFMCPCGDRPLPRLNGKWIHLPLSFDNGRSPHGHINQRLQIQFRAPDDERCAARNMLSLQ